MPFSFSSARSKMSRVSIRTSPMNAPAADWEAYDGQIPSVAELDAAGPFIGEVRIDSRDIFDLADEKENGILYRAANALHIQTRAGVVRRQLLFKPGEIGRAHV